MTYLGPKVMGNFRQRTPRSEKAREKRVGVCRDYLALIRSLPSCVSGGRPVDPHHLTGGPAAHERGVGMKATDKWCVPLTRDEHNDLHQVGSRLEREWFANRGIPDVYDLACKLYSARNHGRGRMRLVIEARGC
jgi:hypothetical protein